MKIFKILKGASLSFGVLIISLNLLVFFSFYTAHIRNSTDASLTDFRKYLYQNMNLDLYGTWEAHNSTFFAKNYGQSQFRFIGDSEYFAETDFKQGVYSIEVSLNEKYKVSTTNAALVLVEGYFVQANRTLYFPEQEIEAEFVRVSKKYYQKTCTVSGMVSLDNACRVQKGRLYVSFASQDCPELEFRIASHISTSEVKRNQTCFHFMFSLFLLLAQFYFVQKLDEQISRQTAFAHQISILSVLTIATFQLFNGFEHFILSVLGYPYFGLNLILGICFMLSFFHVVLRVVSVILQRQLNQQLEDNPEFSVRTYLFLSYLACHATVLLSFFLSMEFSDSSKIFIYWTLAILPQIAKNFFSDFRFLEKSQFLSVFYFSVIIFAVYQHFYRDNFSYVASENGLTQDKGLEVVLLAFGLILLIAAQEVFNCQQFLRKLRGVGEFDYFRTLAEVSLQKGINLDECECLICLGKIEETVETEEWSSQIEGDELAEYIREKKDKPIMECPCKHLFHSSCLLTWMCVKMECPTCRAKLQPIV